MQKWINNLEGLLAAPLLAGGSVAAVIPAPMLAAIEAKLANVGDWLELTLGPNNEEIVVLRRQFSGADLEEERGAQGTTEAEWPADTPCAGLLSAASVLRHEEATRPLVGADVAALELVAYQQSIAAFLPANLLELTFNESGEQRAWQIDIEAVPANAAAPLVLLLPVFAGLLLGPVPAGTVVAGDPESDPNYTVTVPAAAQHFVAVRGAVTKIISIQSSTDFQSLA